MQRNRAVGTGQGRDRGTQQFTLDVEQRHLPALGEEAFCDRKSDAARSARHQRDF